MSALEEARNTSPEDWELINDLIHNSETDEERDELLRIQEEKYELYERILNPEKKTYNKSKGRNSYKTMRKVRQFD